MEKGCSRNGGLVSWPYYIKFPLFGFGADLARLAFFFRKQKYTSGRYVNKCVCLPRACSLRLGGAAPLLSFFGAQPSERIVFLCSLAPVLRRGILMCSNFVPFGVPSLSETGPCRDQLRALNAQLCPRSRFQVKVNAPIWTSLSILKYQPHQGTQHQ